MNLKRLFSYSLISVISFLFLLIFSACNSSDSFERDNSNILILGSTPENEETLAWLSSALAQPVGAEKVDSTRFISLIQKDSLKYYSAIVLLNPEGRHASVYKQSAVERYVEAGGGVVLINPVAENPYYWPWLSELVNEKGDGSVVKKNYAGGKVVLASPTGELMNNTKEFEKVFSEWIGFAIGDNTYDAANIHTSMAPDEKRFVKKVLDNNVNEPVELAVLPNGKVMFLERDGTVKLYSPEENKTRIIEKFNVSMEGNYEDGMLGLALHPLFEKNGWVFIYYSPKGGEPKQNLSRFKMVGDSLIKSSEKIVLEVPVQRETCCHSGGSIVFGPDGNLYLSTGDNTSSKESDGYTPIDERLGRSPFDAQKSSGNTNDLRGKIIRIKVNSDGSYSIPDGNLFSKDGSEGRPEVYLMGLRNPFRFTVDPTNGYVYWGDVGPDAGKDSELGPKSYDEFNQAKEPGYFGWPYFVGNNISYPDFNFATGEIGAHFNPEKPVNNSPNNTGDTLLPPAQKAMIWYPYDESKEFPMLQTGSRAAMGGPFFYSHLYPENSRVKFPDYYNGKWFIYDWARSWVMVVSFDEDNNLKKIEPFLPEMTFHKPIDMEFGPDGAMYILEYGANYFTNNDDATLSKIEFAGANMLPVPAFAVDKAVGAAPLKVQFSARESYDFDGDQLQYEWFFNGDESQASGVETSHTFDDPGIYPVKLKVTDSKGESAVIEKEIKVGNAMPEVTLNLSGNKSFFFDNTRIPYTVKVVDEEDGSTEKGEIATNRVIVSFDYLPHGKDLGLIEPQNLSSAAYITGKNLVENSDCKSCHALDKKSIGPSYLEVAARYKSEPYVLETLGRKIIDGGNGNWGHSMMAAHPQHSIDETKEMVAYILSLDDKQTKSLSLKGEIMTNKHAPDEETGSYLFLARYVDEGGAQVGPLTGTASLMLRHPKVQAETYDSQNGVSKYRPQGGSLGFIKVEKDGAFIKFNAIDLNSIREIKFNVQSNTSSRIILYAGSPSGEKIGEIGTQAVAEKKGWNTVSMKVENTTKQDDIFVVFKGNFEEKSLLVDWLQFEVGK